MDSKFKLNWNMALSSDSLIQATHVLLGQKYPKMVSAPQKKSKVK